MASKDESLRDHRPLFQTLPSSGLSRDTDGANPEGGQGELPDKLILVAF